MEITVQPLSGHDLTGMVMMGSLFIGAAVVGLAYVLVTGFCQYHRIRVEGSLKLEMIRQGRSAAEIERVLRATGDPNVPVAAQTLQTPEVAGAKSLSLDDGPEAGTHVRSGRVT